VVEDDDGVEAVADELVELDVFEFELVELLEFELVELLVPDVVADVVADFVADVVLDATDVPDWVVAAITPVRASIPATLTAPAARRERRAGCGRRRLRDRAAGTGRREDVGSGFWLGSVGWSVIGRLLWARSRLGPGSARSGSDDRAEPSDEPWDALGPPTDLRRQPPRAGIRG
jgi:hypothetical protein